MLQCIPNLRNAYVLIECIVSILCRQRFFALQRTISFSSNSKDPLILVFLSFLFLAVQFFLSTKRLFHLVSVLFSLSFIHSLSEVSCFCVDLPSDKSCDGGQGRAMGRRWNRGEWDGGERRQYRRVRRWGNIVGESGKVGRIPTVQGRRERWSEELPNIYKASAAVLQNEGRCQFGVFLLFGENYLVSDVQTYSEFKGSKIK